MKRLIPLLLLISCNVCLAESGSYLVEVIIFRNLEAMAEPIRAEQLRSFSQYPELREPEPAVTNELTSEDKDKTGDIPEAMAELLSTDLPDELSVIKGRSTYMDDVWRRLRSSRAYRPLHFSAWQQNRVDYYPPMRIHDETILETRLESSSKLMVADLTSADPLAAYRTHFYQIDGNAQLRRSRFLHIHLDLEYREKAVPVLSEADFLRRLNEKVA